MAFSPDSGRIASGDDSGTISIWETGTGTLARSLNAHIGRVMSVAFSPDGKYLASCSGGGSGPNLNRPGEVKLWDAATWQEMRLHQGFDDHVWCVAFSPDGRYLAATGHESVVVWDVATGKEARSLRPPAYCRFVTFSPDSQRLAACGTWYTNGEARIWEMANGKEVLSFKGHSGGINAAAFSPDGKSLATAGDSTVMVWSVTTGRILHTWRGPQTVNSVVFSPDGQRLASASWPELDPTGTVEVWDAEADQECRTLVGHSGSVYDVAFSPDGERIASTSSDNTVRVWEASTGKQVLAFKNHASVHIGRVLFSPDGKRIASCNGPSYREQLSGEVMVWDPLTGAVFLTVKRDGPIRGLAFSPDGKLLALGHQEVVELLDLASGKEIGRINNHGATITGLAFSPDGQMLASSGVDEQVMLWRLTDGEELQTLELRSVLEGSFAFGPDSKHLAFAGKDGKIDIWEVGAEKPKLTLSGHSGLVYQVAFSPDGQRLASAGSDKTVKIWELTTGQEVLSLRGHNEIVMCVAFSPDGQRLVSAGFDTTLKVWDAPLPLWNVIQEKKAGRLVKSAFDKLIKYSAVVDSISRNPALSAGLRRTALAQADRYPRDVHELNQASWNAVRQPGEGKSVLTRALAQAEEACRVAPNDGNCLNTLGIAQFRLGRYSDALNTLERSESLNTSSGGPHPADLAFRAMAEHQLGKKDEAKTTLARLREVIKHERWANNAEAQGFLREAEELIEGKPADKKN